MNLDYQNDYQAMMDFDNPYSYNFGRTKKEHTHSDVFNKFQNKMNSEYYNEK